MGKKLFYYVNNSNNPPSAEGQIRKSLFNLKNCNSGHVDLGQTKSILGKRKSQEAEVPRTMRLYSDTGRNISVQMAKL